MSRPADRSGSDLAPEWAELRIALTTLPRTLPPRWLYDDRGSDLFTEITALEEYYPTETERRILRQHGGRIADRSAAVTMVELGSGTSDKTRTLLDAFEAHGTLRRFVPVDVSEQTLLDAADLIAGRHPTLTVEPVVGDFTRDLHRLADLADDGPRLVVFLGGTIGNFYRPERAEFLRSLASVSRPGDRVLVGIDTVKQIERLLAAYDDPHGVTEAFIRNALVHVAAVTDGDLDADDFDYVPFWDGRAERIDMRLRARRTVEARLRALDLDLVVAAGEEIRVEISTKFRPDALVAELADVGFDGETDVFTDDAGDFAVVLATRT